MTIATEPIEVVCTAFQISTIPLGMYRKTHCPLASRHKHDDRQKSLSIRHHHDGSVSLKCFGCGAGTDDILRAVGLEKRQLFPPDWRSNGHYPPLRPAPVPPPTRPRIVGPREHRPSRRGPLGEIECVYPYHDPDGHPVHRTVRYRPKDFRQEHWDGEMWRSGGPPDRVTYPYNLPAILAAPAGEVLFFVEGEKDADRLIAEGFLATTAGSCNAWKADFAQWLAGKRLVIIPDHDDPGKDLARRVRLDCRRIVQSCRILYLPDQPEGGDVSDFLNANNVAEFSVLVGECLSADGSSPLRGDDLTNQTDIDAIDTSSEQDFFQEFAMFAQHVPPEPAWVLKPLVGLRTITKLDGAPKTSGKTTFAFRLIRSVLEGTPFLGQTPERGVVVLMSEEGRETLTAAARRAGIPDNCPNFYVANLSHAVDLDWPETVRRMFQHATRLGAKLLVIDTIPACAKVHGDAENSAGEARANMDILRMAVDASELGVLATFHDGKADLGPIATARGSSEWAGRCDIVLRLTPEKGMPDNVRKLTSFSRLTGEVGSTMIELSADGYRERGSRQDVAMSENERVLYDVLPPASTLAIDEVTIIARLREQHVPSGRETVRALLHVSMNKGMVERIGAGKAGSPYRYCLSAENPRVYTSRQTLRQVDFANLGNDADVEL